MLKSTLDGLVQRVALSLFGAAHLQSTVCEAQALGGALQVAVLLAYGDMDSDVLGGTADLPQARAAYHCTVDGLLEGQVTPALAIGSQRWTLVGGDGADGY